VKTLDETIDGMLQDDLHYAVDVIRRCQGNIYQPDLTIAPDGEPYLYRWHLLPCNKDRGNLYFHLQVASDPERPLHDHPWDNTSVILAGGYDEIWDEHPATSTYAVIRELRKGDVVHRKAEEAHRLVLPKGIDYTMTLFFTGPKVKEWGFWYPDGWHDSKRHVADRGGQSVHVKEGE
jgi:hypothetical protein